MRSFAFLLALQVAAAATITVDSFQSGNSGTNAIDLNNATFWHSQYQPAVALPHVATLDLGIATWINGFTYLPRQDVRPDCTTCKLNGNIGRHDIQISVDNARWTTVVSQTTYADTAALKTETFAAVNARYVRITAFTEAGNRGPWTSAAELGVLLRGNTVSSAGSSSSSIRTSSSSPSPTILASSSSVSPDTAPARTISATVRSIAVNCAQSGSEGSKAIDGDRGTIWHSQWSPEIRLPHNAVLDLGTTQQVTGITYLPRQDVPTGGKINGNFGSHTIETSTDNLNWIVAARSTFVDDATLKRETFPAVSARYVRVTVLTEAGNRGQWASAAELGVLVVSNAVVDFSSTGKWSSVIQLPLVAAGAFMIPESGKVLIFSASGRTDFESAKGYTQTSTYDPKTGAVTEREVRNTGHDMFCPGLSLDFNGRAIVTGGNDNFPTSIYTPLTDVWTRAADMKLKRGYQSSTTLSNGQVFQIGGSWVPGALRGGKNGEIYNPATNTWTLLPGCPVAPMLTNDAQGIFRSDNHGWLFAWKDATVFQAGPSRAMNWYGTSGSGSQTGVGNRAADADSMCGTAVMYDALNGKIFTAGGSPNYELSDATTNVHLITIGNPGSAPSVTKTTSMTYARAFHNSVVLPDGKIFTTGGQSYSRPFSDATAIMQPEMWDPESQNFTILPSHEIPRTYHSIALLLLDGTVFTGGGGLCGGCRTNHLDAEIFSPGYLFNPNGTAARRPVISTLSASTTAVGSSLTVTTDTAVTKFSLVRYGSTTHTVNTDQRRIPLDAVSGTGNTYTVTIPRDPGIALPGYWMLFALNSAGVPSVAKTVKITL
ncbi:carbohydrate-binding module family 32 [Didymella exigua CBS 183.55]|uniref:Carbohydrate-binding module family 32 n=1 Tax=Didymella exigua CBS 183.55 TaxID=1150837 RepID=A0A6A5RHE3_9PLEO|nr:carbohydrate-binding module family 32 [Didymella exigua CBS 183.55]KAF1925876.1 carbohydrate-binding module family 32 [Didymella exigua CBS 183.55]